MRKLDEDPIEPAMAAAERVLRRIGMPAEARPRVAQRLLRRSPARPARTPDLEGLVVAWVAEVTGLDLGRGQDGWSAARAALLLSGLPADRPDSLFLAPAGLSAAQRAALLEAVPQAVPPPRGLTMPEQSLAAPRAWSMLRQRLAGR